MGAGLRRRSNLTPDIGFDPRLGSTGRYVNLSTGRIISNQAVANAHEIQIGVARQNVRGLSEQLARQEISLADWQTQMAREIKTIHTQSAALAKGGWGQMTQSDWGAVGRITRNQYEFLENFAREIAEGDQRLINLAGQINGNFLRRSDLYAQAGITTRSEMERREARQRNLEFERRVLDARAKHCPCCPEQAGRGWQPLGTLLPIGRCDCTTNCRCHFQFGQRNEQGQIVRIQ